MDAYKHWQRELEQVEADLDLLIDSYRMNTRSAKREIVSKKICADDAESKLVEMLNKFKALRPIKGEYGGNRRESLIHWGQKLALDLERYHKDVRLVRGQLMWLSLISGQLKVNVRADEAPSKILNVLSLSNRLDDMKNTEKSLLHQLATLEREKERLQARYEIHRTTRSNAEAAATLQTDLRKNRGTLYAIANYIKWLTLPARNSTPLERERSEKIKAFQKSSQAILSFCQELLRPSSEVQVVFGDEAFAKVNRNINKIKVLRSEIDVLNDKVMAKHPNKSSVKVLKKVSLKAKSSRHI